jgi:hypothetical protein
VGIPLTVVAVGMPVGATFDTFPVLVEKNCTVLVVVLEKPILGPTPNPNPTNSPLPE